MIGQQEDYPFYNTPSIIGGEFVETSRSHLVKYYFDEINRAKNSDFGLWVDYFTAMYCQCF